MPEKIPVPQELASWAKENHFDTRDINSLTCNAMTPLMLSAMQGNVEMVQALLAAGADTDLLNDDENNALWFACVSNITSIVDEILRYGCNIDNQNVNGATCLIYAASSGKLDIVKQLVEAGADISKQTLDGFNALDSATTLSILKYLKLNFTNPKILNTESLKA